MRRTERGFSLIEIIIAGAIAVLVGFVALAATRHLLDAASRLNLRLDAQSNTDRLAERLNSDATSAWAVFVPAADVLGNTNTDGHEVDFYSQDGSHRPYLWAYRYDPLSQRVTRYTYATGTEPVSGETLGPFSTFSATAAEVTDLSNPSSNAFDPLFAHTNASRVRYAFAAANGAIGGNGFVRLHLIANGVDRTEVLASGTAPTSFTVVVSYTPTPAPLPTPTPSPLPTSP